MRHFLAILEKPDNLPIVLMVAGFAILLAWWWRRARRDDRLLAEGGLARLADEMDGPPVPGGAAENLAHNKVATWPHLLRVELIGALVVSALLGVWTILVDAPLEQIADPGRTPNPAKAPWYFLGLQEMLVYFDPWIAGVMLPLLIIFGLCAIPYLDPNPTGAGHYTWRSRRLAIATFLFGFAGLWLPLIVIGTFFRGPGWGWFWPWQPWDAAAVADHPTRDLPLPAGAAALALYFGLGFALALSPRVRASEAYRRLGAGRVATLAFLALAMLGLPIKIALRLLFDVKYVLVTPWLRI